MLCFGFVDPKGVKPGDMSQLDFIRRKITPLEPLLLVFRTTLDGLDNAFHRWRASRPKDCHSKSEQEWLDLICNYRYRTSSYEAYVCGMKEKCSTALQLLNGILDFNNQNIARQQNERVYLLTNSTVDDSATVRVITGITLIFLSFTAVAVSRPAFSQDRTDI